MNHIYFFILSFFVGIATALGFFSVCSYYLKKMFLNLIPRKKVKEFDTNMSLWWESSISKRPSYLFRLSLQSITKSFVGLNNRPDKIKILFLSYGFTLSALTIGYFFSNIGSYLTIYHNFPINFYDSLQIQTQSGAIITDQNAISQFRSKSLIVAKSELFSNIIYFFLSFIKIIV